MRVTDLKNRFLHTAALGLFGVMLAGMLFVCTDTVYAASESSTVAEIDETNFPDDNFRNFVTFNYDVNRDGALSSKECDAVTEMDVHDRKISSLKGIEYFTELENLQCAGNALSSLDVSKNTKLTQLDCGDNKLTKLDVSKLTKLTSLRCDGNKLTKLDVSKLTKLKTLYCYNNKLVGLDVTKNKKLTSLRCYGNKLTVLDISKNTKLENLRCDRSVRVTTAANSKVIITRY